MSPIVKYGHPLSGKVRKFSPLNQTLFLNKLFNKNPLETISAEFKCELTKRQQLMDKKSLIYCTWVCVNNL